MKIKHLKIENFKAISFLEISDLKDTVVIAGPNGCGKSCIFEAIKLLKTTYGSYTSNETSSLENELQITRGNKKNFNIIKRDKDKKIVIEISFHFSDEEKNNIKQLFNDCIEEDVLIEMVPKAQIENVSVLAIPHQLKERHESEVQRRREKITNDLEQNNFTGRIEVTSNNRINYNNNYLLNFVFSHWDGDSVGVMHLTTAERQFNRSQINSVNINLSNIRNQSASHSLYGTNNRYTQFQNQLASHTAYSALRKDLGVEDTEDSYFQESLTDLFQRFIPGKRYIGPDFDEQGNLDFFVETYEGFRHGINDLSSGEKQILFGYIELFNSAPKNSILMIDEPELHLNPRLVRSLPNFYDRHIGKHFNNQLWLITHSDALLREACKSTSFSVAHMRPSTGIENQLVKINEDDDTNNAIIDLVGDIGQLSDKKPIVFIEGENSEFDKEIIETFFPAEANQLSLVSSGSRSDAISSCRKLTKVPGFSEQERKVYALVDRDHGTEKNGPHIFSWDRFHIENFLLDETSIFEVTRDLDSTTEKTSSPDKVLEVLKSIAETVIVSLSNEYAHKTINQRILEKIKLNTDYRDKNAHIELTRKIIQSTNDVKNESSSLVEANASETLFNEKLTELRESLNNEEWIYLVRGRDVLQKYAATHTNIKYKIFISLLKNKIKSSGREPQKMLEKLKQIIIN